MRYLLNGVYLTLLAAASPWLVLAAIRHGKYRDGLAQKLLGLSPRLPEADCRIWFHAVSVGEVNLLQPVLTRLRQARPDAEVVISTTTKTGYALAQQKYADHVVFYCPLDFSWALTNAFQRIKPQLLVLAELELWPNMLIEAKRRHVPVAIINGRLSDRSMRGYLRLRPFFRRWLSSIRSVAAQSQICAERFVALGVPAELVRAVGSVKFDGAETDRGNRPTQELSRLAGLDEGDIVFLAGSTQAPEEQLAIRTFQRLSSDFPQLRLILAPRHPERAEEVAKLLDRAGADWIRRSKIQSPLRDRKILLVDTVGELGAWWGCAEIGFVGGSMGDRGGQNMLEPCGYGVATCFGPCTRNFRDVVSLLLDAEAAVVVYDADSLCEFVRSCLAEHDFRNALGAKARALVQAQRGAADATVSMLLELLPNRTGVAFSTHRREPATGEKAPSPATKSPEFRRRGA